MKSELNSRFPCSNVPFARFYAAEPKPRRTVLRQNSGKRGDANRNRPESFLPILFDESHSVPIRIFPFATPAFRGRADGKTKRPIRHHCSESAPAVVSNYDAIPANAAIAILHHSEKSRTDQVP